VVGRLIASQDGGVGIAGPISIRVCIPAGLARYRRIIIVCGTVTVVVDAVTGLLRVWMHGGVGIVTVDTGVKAIPVRIGGGRVARVHRLICVRWIVLVPGRDTGTSEEKGE
jgi:hypothetical protein